MSIASEITRLQGAKADLKSAIEAKGVSVSSSATLDDYDDYVSQIAAKLQEKTATPTTSNQDIVADSGYDGLSKVTVSGDANLVSENIKSNVSIFGVTGSVDPYVAPVLQDKTITPTAAGSSVQADSGYDGLDTVTINGDNNLVASNVKKDVTIFGVTGSYEGGATPTLQSKTVTPSASSQTVSPDAGYDGLSSVTVNGDADLVASNIKKDVEIFGVTGTYEGGGGGGSTDLNVFVQTTEPTKKDGIWVKDSGTYETTKCIYYQAPLGSFLEPTIVDFLNGDASCATKIIVNGYLYYFSGSSGKSSYKYNLKDKTYTTLNTDLIGKFKGVYGSVYYKGLVYIFLFTSSGTGFYTYNIQTDTLSAYTNIASVSGSYYYVSNVHIYNGSAYMFCNNILIKYDIDNEITSKRGITFSSNASYSTVGGYGFVDNYAYFFGISSASNKKIYRIELIQGTSTEQVYDFSNETDYFPYYQYSTSTSTYAFGNKLYMFYVPHPEQYLTFEISNQTLIKKDLDFNVGLKGAQSIGSYYYGETYPFCLDETTGLLYLLNRRWENYKNPPQSLITHCLQLNDVGSDLTFADGTAVLYLSTYNRFIKLIDDISLYTGIRDTYLMKNGVLDGNHVAFYGDGDRWNVLKNPTNETCTVSFDTDGGSGSYSSQTIVRGGTVTKPGTDPTKSNYEFGGWLLNNKLFDFGSKVSTDCTLVAKWLDTFTVTFDDDNGNTTTEQVVDGQTVTQPTDPASSTGIFKYWTLNGEEFDFDTPITADITLVADYSEFEDIDYIESTGTQYIDTGVSGTFSTSIEFIGQFKFTSTNSAEQAITGSKNSDNQGVTIYIPSNNSTTLSCWCGSGTSWNLGTLIVGNLNSIDLIFYKTQGRDVTLNGTTSSNTTIANNYTSNTDNFGLFSDKANTLNSGIRLAIYSWQIVKDGVTVRNFKPIKITDTGELCLFDTVENKAYHNKGTGQFIGDGYEPIELTYIESTGTQWVNTGVVPKSTTKLDVQFSVQSNLSTFQVMGAQATSPNGAFMFGINHSDTSPSNTIFYSVYTAPRNSYNDWCRSRCECAYNLNL